MNTIITLSLATTIWILLAIIDLKTNVKIPEFVVLSSPLVALVGLSCSFYKYITVKSKFSLIYVILLYLIYFFIWLCLTVFLVMFIFMELGGMK